VVSVCPSLGRRQLPDGACYVNSHTVGIWHLSPSKLAIAICITRAGYRKTSGGSLMVILKYGNINDHYILVWPVCGRELKRARCPLGVVATSTGIYCSHTSAHCSGNGHARIKLDT